MFVLSGVKNFSLRAFQLHSRRALIEKNLLRYICKIFLFFVCFSHNFFSFLSCCCVHFPFDALFISFSLRGVVVAGFFTVLPLDEKYFATFLFFSSTFGVRLKGFSTGLFALAVDTAPRAGDATRRDALI